MDILSKSIKNKVVIVTGGTRGIGFATVKKFLDHGAKLLYVVQERKLWIKH